MTNVTISDTSVTGGGTAVCANVTIPDTSVTGGGTAVCANVTISDTSVTGGGTAVCARHGDGDELYQPPYIHMPGQAGHYEFHNDRCQSYVF